MARRRDRRRTERLKSRSERPSSTAAEGPDPRLGLEVTHLVLIAGGVLVALLGYWLLGRGSISAAPVLLVVAYLVLIPIGLALPARLRRAGSRSTDQT